MTTVPVEPANVEIRQAKDGTIFILYFLDGVWHANRPWRWMDPWQMSTNKNEVLDQINQELGNHGGEVTPHPSLVQAVKHTEQDSIVPFIPTRDAP